MSRRNRPYQPGHVFHLTARTVTHAKWFNGRAMRDRIVSCLRESVPKSDAQLIAYAIMPNHFHIIVRQGSEPLSRLMQPLCQAIALRVQSSKKHEGHVFERSFRDAECRSARHLRNAIVYTHQNPVNGGLCKLEQEYRWSSYCDYFPRYTRRGPAYSAPSVLVPLRLFGVRDDATWDELVQDYERYAAWATERRRCRRVGVKPPPQPCTPAGDHYWQRAFRDRVPRKLENAAAWRPDLRDLARAILNEKMPGVTIAQLRMARGGRAATQVRHDIIERALLAGFRGADIARYLHISHMTVSRVTRRLTGPIYERPEKE